MNISENMIATNPKAATDKESAPLASDLGSRNGAAKPTKTSFPAAPRTSVKGINTLRNRLLLTVLPTVLLPLAIASGVGINFTQRQAKNTFLNNLEKGVFLASETVEELVDDALDSSSLLAANPLITQALSDESKKAQSAGLLSKPIEQVEQQFASTKLLAPNAALNDYLKAVADDKGAAEIILTDRNGFNVAYNVPTSDFVQSDEEWWQIAKSQGATVLQPEFDDSANAEVLELVNSIKDANSGDLLGVTKVGLSIETLNEKLEEFVKVELSRSELLQILDSSSGRALNLISLDQSEVVGEVIGGQPVAEVTTLLANTLLSSNQDPQEFISIFAAQPGITNVSIRRSDISEGQQHFVLSFERGGRLFQAFTVTGTRLVAVASVDQQEVLAAGRELTLILGFTAIVLGILAIGIIVLLARQLSQPLANLTAKAQQVADGDMNVQAELEGTTETVVLADNFNNLVKQVRNLISEQAAIAQTQQQEKEALEQGIYQLLDEVGDALDGDLTVRASLESLEMSTVADLFNAVIDNLNDIAVQVKHSSTQVGSSLSKNNQSVQVFAQQAVEEAAETRKTLASIEQMAHSIQEVSQNATQAANLAKDAYTVTQKGSRAMDQTVASIFSLRSTVDETAAKMKHLEESSQQISQVVGLIEEIALKTNLLAINASRAGEHGQGFSVFGNQLAALAEQSVTATKEIAQIVAAIQLETQEVTQAMDQGISQVVDSARLVKSTKQRLTQVLKRSQSINELMQLISDATTSQTNTSQSVTQLMQQINQQSQQRLVSSQQMSRSIQNTLQVAKGLESAVAQFKVTKEE
jgi:methyl-accepting chemotaxis protein PixJ